MQSVTDMNNINLIRNRLSQNEYEFFDSLHLYLNKNIYFYGSIQRFDYIKHKSDIDIDIFTENERSTIQQLCSYLNMKKSDFRKVVYKIHNKMVYGYKAKYQDEEKKLNIEISIYNEKYKSDVLENHNKGCKLIFLITFILYIVKYFHYELNIVSTDTYKEIKRFLNHIFDDNMFLLLDSD